MNKKLELEIPNHDLECWEKYPKHRWVYDMSRLLDSQGIKWSLYPTDELNHKESVIDMTTDKPIDFGSLYISKPDVDPIMSEVYIIKGETKLTRYMDGVGVMSDVSGVVELRLNAFITLHFSKFTGVVCAKMYGSEIHRVWLRPLSYSNKSSEAGKLISRIYKKHIDSNINGPADRVLQEIVAT